MPRSIGRLGAGVWTMVSQQLHAILGRTCRITRSLPPHTRAVRPHRLADLPVAAPARRSDRVPRRFASRQRPSPVHHSSLIISPRRPRKTNTWPLKGSSAIAVSTFAARQLKPALEWRFRTIGNSSGYCSGIVVGPPVNSHRQRNTILALSRCAIASLDTDAPGSQAAATIDCLNSAEEFGQPLRRPDRSKRRLSTVLNCTPDWQMMASPRWEAGVFSSRNYLPGAMPGQGLINAVDGVIGDMG